MKIDFTETEQAERDFFEAALAEHDLRFLTGLVEVEANAQILCMRLGCWMDGGFIAAHPEFRLVTRRWAGYGHIDVSEWCRGGVIVWQVPGRNANSVAEHTLALRFDLSRRIIEAREVKKKT